MQAPRAESPLYEINHKGKTWFAYTEKDKADIIAKMGVSAKPTIPRSKGLGENDPEMMWMTTMNPASRRLIRVTPSGVQETLETFEVLLGTNLSGRKALIEETGAKYLDLIDVS